MALELILGELQPFELNSHFMKLICIVGYGVV